MSYKIPDSMQKAFKNNHITYVIPEPKIETEPQPDGSIKLVAGWDTKDFAYAMSAIVRQMNEAFDDAIIKEFAASNGYVKKRTYRRITGFKHWPELEPKPCPFCGSNDVAVHYGFMKRYVKCNTCGAKGGARYFSGEAVEVWNKRAKECVWMKS